MPIDSPFDSLSGFRSPFSSLLSSTAVVEPPDVSFLDNRWDVHPDNLAANSDGTGAVTVGDAVGYAEDLQGTGNHLIQTVSGDRPTLRFDGSEYYLEIAPGQSLSASITPFDVSAGAFFAYDAEVDVAGGSVNFGYDDSAASSDSRFLYIAYNPGDGGRRIADAFTSPGGRTIISGIPLPGRVVASGNTDGTFARFKEGLDIEVFEDAPTAPAGNVNRVQLLAPGATASVRFYGASALHRFATVSEEAAVQTFYGLTSPFSAPSQPEAPLLVGGTELANIGTRTTASAGGLLITGYEWEVTDSADTDFSSPVATGTQAFVAPGAEISPLTAGDYIARQRVVTRYGASPWSATSEVATVSASAPAVTLPSFGSAQIFTPDPSQTEIIVSTQANFGAATNPCAYPCLVDVRDLAEFDGVENAAGERLNWVLFGSADHNAIASVYVVCLFGSLSGGEWKTYEDALADGDLANYAGTTPAVAADGGSFNHNPADPISSETPWAWKEGSTWYLTYHGFYGELAQTSQYATSSSIFGPWTNQGGFLPTDAQSNHNGYAQRLVIPPEAEITGPYGDGQTGQSLFLALNNATINGHGAAHVINNDLTGGEMLTALSGLDVPVDVGIAAAGKIFTGGRGIAETHTWIGSEFVAIAEVNLNGESDFGALGEVAFSRGMIEYVREPTVIVRPEDVPLIDINGVTSGVTPFQLRYVTVIDDGGQNYLLCEGVQTDQTYICLMPLTVNIAAQSSPPRLYDDHYYDAVDFAQVGDYFDIPSQWTVDQLASPAFDFVLPPFENGRFEFYKDLGIQYTGFDPANTDWMRSFTDAASTDFSVTSQPHRFGFGAATAGINSGVPRISVLSTAYPMRFEDGTVTEDYSPSYAAYSLWPGGVEWDIAANEVIPLHGNGGGREIYTVTAGQDTTLGAQQLYPFWAQTETAAGNNAGASVGKMSVQYRGAGHTNNAAPLVADAVTDVAGTKVTVTMDRDFLGRYGLVLSVGGTVIDATPTRTGKRTIELTRDSGTFANSDAIKLHYETSGDIRSEPQWVSLPATSDINVKNKVV